MNLQPFWDAGLVIQIHEVTAIAAFVIGAAILWRRKGNGAHKMWGKLWVGLMVVVALSSVFIHEIRMWGDYSPIHILSAVTLINLPLAIWAARQGNVQRHKIAMQSTFVGGMVVAGGLTFLPGRLNHEILFGASQGIGSGFGWAFGIGGVLLFGLVMAWQTMKARTS